MVKDDDDIQMEYLRKWSENKAAKTEKKKERKIEIKNSIISNFRNIFTHES